jgi:aspartate racemase
LILGCTEIPLALHDGDLPVPLIASNQVLAEAALRTAQED